MAAPSYKWTGTTVTGGGTLVNVNASGVRVLSATDSDGDGEIDVTGSLQTKREYEEQMDDESLTIEMLGADGISRGDTGTLTAAWNDGGSTDLGTAVVVSKQKTGSVGDRVVYSFKLRRYNSNA